MQNSAKRRITGGVVAGVGYMLSPLSWWNDLWVNVPLALVFAWTVSFFYPPAFKPCVVLGYWLTNVAGFILMHKGASHALAKEPRKYSPGDLLRDLIISLLYTGLIIALVTTGILKPITAYFH